MSRLPFLLASRTRPPREGSARGLSWVILAAVVTGAWSPPPQLPGLILDRYDLSRDGGSQEKLPRVLEEVSGLALTEGGHLLAHNDERAVVYQLDPSDGTVIKAFSAGIGGIRGDFEGIAAVGRRIFLVTSSGEVLETAEGEDGDAMAYQLNRTRLEGLCEFEGLAYDPGTHSLLLPCKETKTRELAGHLVVLEVKLDPLRAYPVPRIFIPFKELETSDLGDSFHPSAIEIHAETGRAFLISAQEEAILEVSPQGALLGGHSLSGKSHRQPEGITFLRDGTLLIADEGQGKRGRLTRYEPTEPVPKSAPGSAAPSASGREDRP